MAFRLLLLISLLTYNTGFSAEISVFVKTGDSVQLDTQTQELPEFDYLNWRNFKSENIVKYSNETKTIKKLHNSYKDRVDFNTETFSLTLKNMQKTDSGLYRAIASGDSEKTIVTYRVSVIDPVDTPVLTVNSNWSSPEPCSFTCKGSNITISSIYNSTCSPEEVTSTDNYILKLNCSDGYIMCNHSNLVSWKTDEKRVNELCTVDQEKPPAELFQSMHRSWFIPLICVLTTFLLASVIGWCLYKRKKDDSYTPDQQLDDHTVYENVDENINQKRPLEMLEKSTNSSTVYDTVREHGSPDVTVETNQTSPSHDSVNQTATLTEEINPNAPVTLYATIQREPKSDHTIYAVVNKPAAGDASAHPKPE
ncbi:natural killer cell receptor 2B4 [Pseudorasbora parva]|uniref:natural killer cell receptor 2B4 n=1 Tax=Pseudorasbora parva TaxID=51549 RepID=UPI00351F629F